MVLKSRWGMRYFKRPTVGRCARTVSSPGDDAYTCRLKLGWDGMGLITWERLPR